MSRSVTRTRRDDIIAPTTPPRTASDTMMVRAATAMSQQLDRIMPLWELWVVEGLADGTWAQVNKVHHCMVDGLAGMTTLILDREAGDVSATA